MYFFLQWANGVRATKTCGVFICSSSFDEVNIIVKPWGGAKIQQMFIIVRFIPSFFSAEPLL